MESLSDIVAKMRGRGEDGRMDRHLWNEYADRIEAAAKRERAPVGNTAAIREAQYAALRFIGNLEIEPYSPLDEAASELRQRIMDALSAPARQCDVGTAEEQYRRWTHFCKQRLHSCDNCPCNRPEGCGFTFENMPYEAKEGAGE